MHPFTDVGHPIKDIQSPLYVIAVISNPIRFRSRYDLYRTFAKYVEDSGAILVTVEMAFGERLFEITQADNPRHVQVRGSHELWHKENLINIGLSRLPADWKYVAWIDADVRFARPDWVQETLHQLQHYAFVQMFSGASDLGPNYQVLQQHNGFVWCWHNKHQETRVDHGYHHWHPGYAWAANRWAIDAVGGLMDWAIVGSADRHMACAMIGRVADSFYTNMRDHNPTYVRLCLEWQNRCERFIQHNIGFVDGHLLHNWHGKKRDRRYTDRWKVITENQFDPHLDLKRDAQGLWQLTDRNWKLRDELRAYARSRAEDSTDV